MTQGDNYMYNFFFLKKSIIHIFYYQSQGRFFIFLLSFNEIWSKIPQKSNAIFKTTINILKK